MRIFILAGLALSFVGCKSMEKTNDSSALKEVPASGCADATAPVLPEQYYDRAEITDRCMLLWARKGTWLGRYTPSDAILNHVKDQLAAMNAASPYDYTIVSGYRSYDVQVDTFNRWKNSGECAGYENKELCAWSFSAKPGTSEHQLGVVFDLSADGLSPFNEGGFGSPFGKSLAGQWLRDNAHIYGFTMSYPWGKESIHCYDPEPWHWRYVGVRLATDLKRDGMILDELFRREFGEPPHVVACPATRNDYRYGDATIGGTTGSSGGSGSGSPCQASWGHWTSCMDDTHACISGVLETCQDSCKTNTTLPTPNHDTCESKDCKRVGLDQGIATCNTSKTAACLHGVLRGCLGGCKPQGAGQNDICD